MPAKTRFNYPAKPDSIKSEDWNQLKRHHSEESSEEAPIEDTASETVKDATASETVSPPKATITDPVPNDSGRLVDFIERFMLERRKKQNPEEIKRQKAITAYRKNKRSA